MATRIEARREATRTQIIEAAWILAHRDGLGGVGVREIASQLGMAPSSLYGYFSGKDAIYDAMFVQGNEELHSTFAALDAGEGTRAALIAGAQLFVRFCDEDHARFQLLFQNALPGWQPSPEAYESAVANFEQMRSLMSDLGIDDDLSLDLWTALMSGLASQQVANDPGGDRWLRLVETAVDMFMGREST